MEPELCGGNLCLDFTNTVGGTRPVVAEKDRLTGYDALLEWSVAAGTLSDRDARRLERAGSAAPAAAAEVLQRARDLREAIHRVFVAAARDRAPAAADVEILNSALAQSLPHRRVAAAGGGDWRWELEPPGETLDAVLWPIAVSAAELLVSGEHRRVHACQSDDCDWLFLDVSKNKSRRWCSMRDCGNRAKARRHYARQRADKG